jgi:hypothetical protein
MQPQVLSGGGFIAKLRIYDGEVREWLNRAVSKTVIPLAGSGVRIPPSPQANVTRNDVSS